MPKNLLVRALLVVALLCAGMMYAQDISRHRHPNLAEAQRLCARAFEKIKAAQAANEWDMNGHAHKALDLLDQANHELQAAAEQANRNQM
jgi:hypothetical protein